MPPPACEYLTICCRAQATALILQLGVCGGHSSLSGHSRMVSCTCETSVLLQGVQDGRKTMRWTGVLVERSHFTCCLEGACTAIAHLTIAACKM